ncbi:MAG: hypothetical protein ACJ79P_05645 [Myxococcales bacterium]
MTAADNDRWLARVLLVPAIIFIASVPIAFLYNLCVDRFISGFTVGEVKG